jgi:alpha-ketoglutarate-dependent taurine dioxygenase
MARIATETFTYPQVWTASDFDGVEDISVHLGPAGVAALEQRLRTVKAEGLALVDIGREHFRHPDLDDLLAGVLEELMSGRGMVVLRGLPADRYGAEDMAMMYWGIGTHFGTAVSQSALGDVLGHVQNLTKPGEAEDARGYTSARELRLHTDLAQVAGLFCYRPAPSGGVSVIASALAMHNQIAAERPEFLPIYYRGFPYHRRGEQAADAAAVTPHAVPVFSTLRGNTSVFYVREILQNAAEERGVPLTAEEVAALDYFDACARDNSYRLRLGQGDVLFMNNRTTLHARTKFADGDGAEGKRHLMRLWLDVPGKRPDVPEIQIYENQGGRGGIDRQEGRVRAGSKYRIKTGAG